MKWRLAAFRAPKLRPQSDDVQTSVAADQRGEFGPANGPGAAVASRPHGLVGGKVVDRVGEASVRYCNKNGTNKLGVQRYAVAHRRNVGWTGTGAYRSCG